MNYTMTMFYPFVNCIIWATLLNAEVHFPGCASRCITAHFSNCNPEDNCYCSANALQTLGCCILVSCDEGDQNTALAALQASCSPYGGSNVAFPDSCIGSVDSSALSSESSTASQTKIPSSSTDLDVAISGLIPLVTAIPSSTPSFAESTSKHSSNTITAPTPTSESSIGPAFKSTSDETQSTRIPADDSRLGPRVGGGIAAGITSAGAVAVLAAVFFLWRWRAKKQKEKTDYVPVQGASDNGTASPTGPQHQEYGLAAELDSAKSEVHELA